MFSEIFQEKPLPTLAVIYQTLRAELLELLTWPRLGPIKSFTAPRSHPELKSPNRCCSDYRIRSMQAQLRP